MPPLSALETQKTPAQSGLVPPPAKPEGASKEQVPALTKESSRHDGLKQSQQRVPAPKGVVPNRPVLTVGDAPLRPTHSGSTGQLRLFSGSANKVRVQHELAFRMSWTGLCVHMGLGSLHIYKVACTCVAGSAHSSL